MSIPAIQQIHVEVIKSGIVASAGSNTKTSEQVLHFQRVPNSTPVNKLHVESAFQTAIGSKFPLAFSVRYTETQNTVRIIDDALDSPTLVTHSTAGAITGDSMPLTVSAFLKKSTGVRGRSYRGSLKLFPLAESQTTLLTDDELNAAALTLFGNIATAILGGFTDSDSNVWTPVLLSRKLSQLLTNPTNVIATPITAIAVRKTIGHMRHRQVKSQY